MSLPPLVNNEPPVANAGPDKELTLPDDSPMSTELDGSASKDDIKITSYLWTYVRLVYIDIH